MHFFLYAKPKMIAEMIIGVLSYIFYNPTYLILLNIYALCRVDDISWGTKGINSQ
jgi:chitin synthase